MGNFVSKGILDYKRYDMVEKTVFKKLLGMDKILRFENISFSKTGSTLETFYDTKTDMLAKTGIILSKVSEQGKCYIKVQKQSFIPQTFRSVEDVIFVHEIGPRDKIVDHSLYLIDGITTLLATSFNIDLENILKNLVERLRIVTNYNVYRLISGTGLRANIIEEKMTFNNIITKRIVQKDCLKLENISPESYKAQYDALVNLIEQKIKGLIMITESTYDYAVRLTKKIEVQVKDKKKQSKEKNILDKIEG